MQVTMKHAQLMQALSMYIASAKRQANSTNLLPQVKAAIAADAGQVMAIHGQLAGIPLDTDITITDTPTLIPAKNK